MELVVKILPANSWDIRDGGSVPGLGRSPGEGNGNPLQCSCLGNPLDRGAQRVWHDWAESYIFYRSGLQVIHFMVTHMPLAKIQLPNCKIPKKFSVEAVSLKKKVCLSGLNMNVIAWYNEWTKNLAIIETLSKIFEFQNPATQISGSNKVIIRRNLCSAKAR